ncbi:hypothetical protein [Vulcanibacillus modesticaldus]|nr:hypothetical protein [Vulcanibacillus modesticaldus]
MGKFKKVNDLSVNSVSYVNDPDAARKWFDIILEILKEEFEKEASKKMD